MTLLLVKFPAQHWTFETADFWMRESGIKYESVLSPSSESKNPYIQNEYVFIRKAHTTIIFPIEKSMRIKQKPLFFDIGDKGKLLRVRFPKKQWSVGEAQDWLMMKNMKADIHIDKKTQKFFIARQTTGHNLVKEKAIGLSPPITLVYGFHGVKDDKLIRFKEFPKAPKISFGALLRGEFPKSEQDIEDTRLAERLSAMKK